MTPARKKAFVALALFAVSAAMVYGTWLAADDMRAKPMVADVSVEAGALVIVNRGDFAWSDAVYVVNGSFRADAPGPLVPGGRQALPLTAFTDQDGRVVAAAGEPVREVTARATRHSRFGTFNTDRPTTGRWRID